MTNEDAVQQVIPAPGGVPGHLPAPEVPARGHPLPQPEEAPLGPPVEIPVDVPQGPGPMFDGAFWTRPVTANILSPRQVVDVPRG